MMGTHSDDGRNNMKVANKIEIHPISMPGRLVTNYVAITTYLGRVVETKGFETISAASDWAFDTGLEFDIKD
jgi:hypothetical protein